MSGVLSMSEAQNLPASHDPAGQPGAGALLKQAREASGLHIAALAVLLKVPVKKLEALESDRFDSLPDVVFVRALASSVCRALKIDSSTILSRLPQTHVPKLTYQGSNINEPFRSPGDGPGPSIWARISGPGAVAGMLLLLGALVLMFLPAIKAGIDDIRPSLRLSVAKNIAIEKAMPTSAVADLPLGALEAPGVSVVASGIASEATTNSAVAQTPIEAKSLIAEAVSGQLPMPESEVLKAGKSSSTYLTAANSLSTGDLVVFTAKTESWVEATDSKGLVVLRRRLAAGEVAGASGALPLKVVVGRANATQVEIRGKMFDVTAIAKDNVARFEVN